jgi:hypothetical protein
MKEIICVSLVAMIAVLLNPLCSSLAIAVTRYEESLVADRNEAFNQNLIEQAERQRSENAGF